MPALSRRFLLPGVGLASLPGRVAGAVLMWQERVRQRHMLASMDDHLLRDLGLSRSEAQAEWEKPFWRR
jgi:uncharacterized protein YjiS (DUF1127 family)